MLTPRETDVPALFIVFVVLPLVTYFILGKWSETSKRKEGISLIAGEAAEEALQVDPMAVGGILPVVHMPNSGIHQCARCFNPAGTRCSQCKSVWYCSGRCQIVHWRDVHKLECQQMGKDCHRSSLKCGSEEGSRGRESYGETTKQSTFQYNVQQPSIDGAFSEDLALHPLATLTPTTTSAMVLSASQKSVINKLSAEFGTFLTGQVDSSKTADGAGLSSFVEACGSSFTLPNSSQPSEDPYLREVNFPLSERHANNPHASKDGTDRAEIECQNALDGGNNFGIVNSSTAASNCASNLDMMRMKGMKKSAKVDNHQHLEDSTTKKRKVKMIFPYEEFVKCFQYENFTVTPRGLVNCGNSCYANAVLQCLIFTKPLIIYLLCQTHSRTGCAKDWCLTCELEQLVMMLGQNGGPLSPINILLYIRSLNAQIGYGSQEDAHEFLRLLVASMQTICLEGFGGENVVDPRRQDTTFIQHTFGGTLRSKVKCMICHHESERYEKMMDLTLEIFGWVKSLEDALTQFTSEEDLVGDNMYRCARCATYVHARKQLHIKEAPNILTIVLKRFQEGNYGKINKCITFPEMLDMIPFMTGTDDIPPLYMLYAVVVHHDTSNASFSGHYTSYVKDLQGNWFRVDDTEVQPVELSHVMSEGAYILFYMRSHPRPTRCGKSSRNQAPRNRSLKGQRASRPEPNNLVANETIPESSNGVLIRESRSRPSSLRNYTEFSDAASSDWSVFTNSDDSSFTTESTRDSFSTVDHGEAAFSSIYQSMYPVDSPTRRNISCSMFPGSKAQTRFAAREERGFVSVSCVNYGSEARTEGVPQTSVDCSI
ncbi:ubiquitin carboxyl-terminal hydrolase 15-like [Salvia hispanica]|uniref:ubiquitin carboxyl-terminal hydrolase 15-like n=1 Tax=Salvia hispanica TaxID=49212 RepID=UPI0020094647|nr:ubiquitin carboxyl-terminal hydrolase 15-like [Salvia hispanica]